MQQNIEFERCIDFLVRMIDKYGEEVLRELEEEKQNKEEKTAQNTSFHSICKTVEVSFSQVRLAILHRKQSLSFFRLTRNHFMPRIDSYDHAEQRATSKILMSGFHIFIASIKDSNHCCQCTK